MNDHTNRVTLSGFSPDEGNPLLLLALMDGERLAKRLLQVATETGIAASERAERLQALQQQLTALRYDEEVAICAAIARGDDVTRSASSPAWAVLMIEVEHQQAAAA